MNNYIIYKHIFPNKKVYIGITKQLSTKRWNNGYGYITSCLMYNAIQKYKWHNVEHKILYTDLTKQEAENMEIELIKECKSNQRKYGYNIANGGSLAGVHSQLTKDKISKKHLGKKLSEKHKNNIKNSHLKIIHYNNRQIEQYDLYNNFIKLWSSSSEIEKILNISHQNIIKVCQNNTNRKTSGGYKWKYKDMEVMAY